MTTRRMFLAAGAAVLGASSLPPRRALAQDGQGGDTYETDSGEIVVHPVEHASFVMETPAGTIFVDPVGDAARYDRFGTPDLILITHEHSDHYDPDTLTTLSNLATQIVANIAVYDMLPEALKVGAQKLANGDSTDVLGMTVEAVPAYNITEGRLDFHPEGRDNGYVLNIDGRRVYVAGDTEGTDEMRALDDIFIAFVPMNLPFTMDAEQAADAVAEFAPQYVYPYHYRGRDSGTQDPQEFARMLADRNSEVEVRQADWYAGG
ncbi:putative metal-dependent hydrolase [Oceaniovalibus guishaninsula JLT2003]|uniref:Putative metal-dependent hydrolase n=1 Tax=Oceaniovalibus guishaninsula JLT2003 TaxID=1231392 RepID=K2HD85_9RHOB|nr:MBL fold metallo-hydrolase [Oceaniovalibus guishaninsula]EKE45423.1 putative metal-dependent hydrolase [Oceaniovalibus guishaninsula JLT2003]